MGKARAKNIDEDAPMLATQNSPVSASRAGRKEMPSPSPAGGDLEMLPVPAGADSLLAVRSATRPKLPKRGYRQVGEFVDADDASIAEPGGIELDDTDGVERGGAHAVQGQSSFWVIAANNVVYMAAPLSLPATMASCGWKWGTLILSYSIVSTYHSALLLGEVMLGRPHLDSYPKVVGEALVVFAKAQLQGVPLDLELLRRVGYEMTVVLQFLSYFFDSTAQVLYCAEYFDQLLPHLPLCQKQWLLFTWLLTIPLMQVGRRAPRRAMRRAAGAPRAPARRCALRAAVRVRARAPRPTVPHPPRAWRRRPTLASRQCRC